MAATAKRATIWKAGDGLWRYKVQSSNWRTIDSSNIGTERRRTVERIIERRYPGIDIIVKEA